MCINDDDAIDQHLLPIDFNISCHEFGDKNNINIAFLDDGVQIVATQGMFSTKKRYVRQVKLVKNKTKPNILKEMHYF